MFLLIFLSLYGLIHAYAFYKLHLLIGWKRPWPYLISVVFLFLLMFPVLGHWMAARGMESLSFLVLFAGYEWMGMIFLFVSAHLFLDSVRILIFPIHYVTPWLSLSNPLKRRFMVAVSAAALAAFVYGHFEARAVRVNRVELVTSKLPGRADPLRIAQISDLHFTRLNGVALAKKVADMIEDMSPDILVATGDLVDRDMRDSAEIAGIFRSIKAPLGKYAVMGNHEVYRGLEMSTEFLERSGFRVLRGEVVAPAPWLSITGVDDDAAKRRGGAAGLPLEDLLERLPREDLVLVLRHRPYIIESTLGLFDLQLSGHTHGGQIFPFGLIVAGAYPYLHGFYKLEKGSSLYVNRGAGTWGPPLRIGSPPEVTLVVCRTGGGKP